MEIKQSVVVTLQHEAVHNWPGVVDHTELEDVYFLQHPHRHQFHIKCQKAVTHDDRDVEIIIFKRQIQRFLDEQVTGEMGAMSCEQLAKMLVETFDLESCEVLEDGENGAIAERSHICRGQDSKW